MISYNRSMQLQTCVLLFVFLNIVVSLYLKNINNMSTPIVKSARFVISNTDIKKCPQDGKPEYAFIGRSNVGKSSLINALTNQKKLAQTSATPGKTLLINHYLINNEWYLVDLPAMAMQSAASLRTSNWSTLSQAMYLTVSR